jgi:hypothetical protein
VTACRCDNLVVCPILLMDGYVYHVDYCIYFNYLDDACFMHVIAYRCKPNILA